ncbi:MAG: hypothetical protein GF332_04515 [Candidatus Moranbacteria bacterium]|nr:hypothetical protein [Candidatus Moranbacteria bacterium]
MHKSKKQVLSQEQKEIYEIIKNASNSSRSPQEELKCEDNFLSCKLISMIFGKKIGKIYVDIYLRT